MIHVIMIKLKINGYEVQIWALINIIWARGHLPVQYIQMYYLGHKGIFQPREPLINSFPLTVNKMYLFP